MQLHVVYWEAEGKTANAVIDQISGAVFGKTGTWAIGYYVTQFFTAAILVLAANTSFADFPRLSSILARDRYLPKQFSNLGDKLVFNNGIFILGLFAALLVVVKERQRGRPDPAVRDWRLSGVHAVAKRHGDALAQTEAARLAGQSGDQWRGRGGHVPRADGHRLREVSRRRVGRYGADRACSC